MPISGHTRGPVQCTPCVAAGRSGRRKCLSSLPFALAATSAAFVHAPTAWPGTLPLCEAKTKFLPKGSQNQKKPNWDRVAHQRRSGPRPSHRTRGTSTRPAGRGRQHARAVDPADRAHHGRRRRYGRAAVRGPLDFQAEQGACACLPASSLPAPLPGRCRGCWGALPSCGCTRSVADTAA